MPTIDVDGVTLYYEEHGEGPPFVLIQGLGIPGAAWYNQVPEFSARYRVILPDNRGSGRSDQTKIEYSVPRMADDVIALLDHLGVERAHVLGLSLGGLIAQQLAISYPERVFGLILVSTQPGGPPYLEATGEMWKERLNVAGKTIEQIYREALEWGAAPAFIRERPEEVERFLKMRLQYPQSGTGFQGQFTAGAAFDAREELYRIKAPTLVIHGTEDQVVPPRFGSFIAERIPGARIHWLEGVGHLAFVEAPSQFNAVVLSFLDEVATKGGGQG